MRRSFWFAAGAGAGIYAMVRARRAAEAVTPDGLRDRWQALGLGARMLREEVAQGKAEAEVALRARFGEADQGRLAARHRAALERKTAVTADPPVQTPTDASTADPEDEQ